MENSTPPWSGPVAHPMEENSTPHGAGRWPTPWRMLPVVQNPRKCLDSALAP